jgi:hypothetical protein
MIDVQVVLPAFFSLFGQVGGRLLQAAAEKHVEGWFEKGLDRASALGKKSALTEAMERAYGGWLEVVLKNLEGIGYDAEDLAEYKESFERLLGDRELGEELARPILEGEEWPGPEPRLFVDAWARLGCRPLPAEFRWPAALAAFERQVRKQRVLTPELRAVLNAVNLGAIREEMRWMAGVRPEGNEQRYAAAMRQRYRVLDLLAIARPEEERLRDLELREVFLPQDVRENPPPVELPWDLRRKLAMAETGERGEADAEVTALPKEIGRERLERMRAGFAEQPRQPVLTVLSEPASRRSVLLGDPGSGKSTLARYLLLSVLDAPRAPETGGVQGWIEAFAGCLPLLIEIRQLIGERSRGSCQTFLEFLGFLGRTEGYALEEIWLDRRLRSGRSLVIFDGLDEIFDGAERERVIRQITGFASDYPQASVLVTSRSVGYSDHVFRGAGFRHCALQDLDDAQVERFVRGWYALVFPARPEEAAPRVERVLRACEQSRSIRLLAGNPMLLTIMAMIARQQELPRERARFYEHSAEILCHHWEMNRWLRGAGVEFDYIGLDDKKELLRRIAFRMQAGPESLAGNFIHGDELQQEIEAYLRERYRSTPVEAKRVAEALIAQLHERNYILCLYGPRLYGFVHRTFLEYFCAEELRRRVQEDPGYPIDRLLEEVIAKHWREPAWNEVLRLLCGMVGDLHAGRIIEYLTRRANPFWEADPQRRPPRHLVIATQCLAEVRNRYAMEGVCLGLLQEITRALELWVSGYEEWVDRFATDLPAPFEEIGGTWPGSAWLRERGLRRIGRVDKSFKVVYVRLVVSLFRASATLRGELETLVNSRDAASRSAVLVELARGWREDAAVRLLLEQRALQDEASDVRNTALVELARGWQDDAAMRQLLEQRALQDEGSSVRGTALGELARGWRDDPAVRQLLKRRALRDRDSAVRSTALEELARGWRDDAAVRQLLEKCALQDEDEGVRGTALRELARGWREDTVVRQLLEKRALQDHFTVRRLALRELARGWREDAAVRQLLEQRGVQDKEYFVRMTALEELARGWRETAGVRQLLEQCALHDEAWGVRWAALSELARGWREDRAVRQLVEQRALHDGAIGLRQKALEELARGWQQGGAGRQLLEQRALLDEASDVRSTALEELARGWQHDAAVRELLEQRALQDEASDVRGTALGELARGWRDDPAVRKLLERRALRERGSAVRSKALEELARGWRDDSAVRQLLEKCALQDEDEGVRGTALRELARGWRDDTVVRQLLEQRAREDEATEVRESAFQGLVQVALDRRAAIVLSRGLNGAEPFLDPRSPMAAEHLERAAARLGIGMDALVVQLEEHSKELGWNLRKGLRRGVGVTGKKDRSRQGRRGKRTSESGS